MSARLTSLVASRITSSMPQLNGYFNVDKLDCYQGKNT
jgi:hypothetical protein